MGLMVTDSFLLDTELNKRFGKTATAIKKKKHGITASCQNTPKSWSTNIVP